MRIDTLIEKRKNLTATLAEEKELIDLAKTLPEEELSKIDKRFLVLSSEQRLLRMTYLLDKMLTKLDEE